MNKKKQDLSNNGQDKKDQIEKPIKMKQIKGKVSFVCAGKYFKYDVFSNKELLLLLMTSLNT